MKNTKLIVLRGPSGAGKSSVAKAVRAQLPRGVALIEQDYIRRILLQEKEIANGLNIELIKKITLFALEHSYSVILEGIFTNRKYNQMFADIIKAHPRHNYFFYFDVSFAETLRRHNSKPNKDEFGEKEMRDWYNKKILWNVLKRM